MKKKKDGQFAGHTGVLRVFAHEFEKGFTKRKRLRLSPRQK